jgi:hypothetical protein
VIQKLTGVQLLPAIQRRLLCEKKGKFDFFRQYAKINKSQPMIMLSKALIRFFFVKNRGVF